MRNGVDWGRCLLKCVMREIDGDALGCMRGDKISERDRMDGLGRWVGGGMGGVFLGGIGLICGFDRLLVALYVCLYVCRYVVVAAGKVWKQWSAAPIEREGEKTVYTNAKRRGRKKMAIFLHANAGVGKSSLWCSLARSHAKDVRSSAFLFPALQTQGQKVRVSGRANGLDFQLGAGIEPHMTALPAFPSSRASPLPPTASPTPLRYFSLSPIALPALSHRCLISLRRSSASAFSAGQ